MTQFVRPLGLALTLAALFACRPESKASRENATRGDEILPIENVSGSQSSESASRTAAPSQPNPAPADPSLPPAPSAENTNPVPNPTPTPADPLTKLREQYNINVKAIIDNQCQMCHGRRRSLNFSDFEKIKADAGLMADAVSNGSMPPNASRFPANDRETLVKFLTELAAQP